MGASKFRLFVVASIIFCSAACTKVPNLYVEQESIRLLDVVKRVKCDLYFAVSTERYTPNGPIIVPISKLHDYTWLANWVMQVNLNLLVNDQSGLTPGVTLIDPLTPATLKGIGTFSQMFSAGIGGGVNTTAQRTETISFSLSFTEIEAELGSVTNQAKYNYCNLSDGVDLDADLRLKEWIWSSLAPVHEEYLKPGHHKSPKSGGTSTPAAGGAKALAGSAAYTSFTQFEPKHYLEGGPPPLAKELNDLMEDIRQTIILIQSTWKETELGTEGKPPVPGAVSDRELKRVFDRETQAIADIRSALSLINSHPNDTSILAYISDFKLKDLKQNFDLASFRHYLQSLAISFGWDLRLFQLSRSKDSTPDQIRGLIRKLDADIAQLNSWESTITSSIVSQLRTVRSQLIAALNSFDPPIDSLSHQVQSIVAWSGNIGPSWSLVKFRGPSPSSGSLVSGSSSNTHTLSIVLGQPGTDTTNTLAALQIGNSVQSALNNTTVKVTLPP